MKIVVGLGNPGREYQGTRHNVGFEVLRELAERNPGCQASIKHEAELREFSLAGCKVLLVAPMTFMNLSGKAVQPLVRFYKTDLTDVVVVCDDMNLPPGRMRWRAGGSAGGQNGLKDILQRLGSDEVPRLRIGIGRPPGKRDATGWVLGRMSPEEKSEFEITVREAADSVELWIREGLDPVMNRYNVRTGKSSQDKG